MRYLLSLVLTTFVIADSVSGADHHVNLGLHDPRHLQNLKAIVKLHEGGFTKPPFDKDFPPGFRDHPGQVVVKQPVCLCNYRINSCTFSNVNLDFLWHANVNNNSLSISEEVVIPGGLDLAVVNIVSQELTGTRCLFFSTYSSAIDISFAVSFLHGNGESTTPIPGNKNSIKRITVGVGTDKPYRVLFHIYAFSKDKNFHKIGRPNSGLAIIGKIRFIPGPCSRDVKSLNCTFDYGLCHWKLHDKKHIWYPLPFGLDHHVKHKIEWGALAPFGGHGNLWSPIVKSLIVRCFSFLYAKGVSSQSFLRVWLLYKIPGLGTQRVLLFEDVSFHKVIKKLVQINLFVPFNFQIAFEGRSKTILHGVVILHTSISPHPCKGIGLFSDVRRLQIAPTPPSGGFTFKPSFTVKSLT